LAPVAALFSVHHLRPRAGLVGPLSVTRWGIVFICGVVLRCAGTLKPRLESGPVTGDLTTAVVHSYKLLINDFKLVHTNLILFITNLTRNFSFLQLLLKTTALVQTTFVISISRNFTSQSKCSVLASLRAFNFLIL